MEKHKDCRCIQLSFTRRWSKNVVQICNPYRIARQRGALKSRRTEEIYQSNLTGEYLRPPYLFTEYCVFYSINLFQHFIFIFVVDMYGRKRKHVSRCHASSFFTFSPLSLSSSYILSSQSILTRTISNSFYLVHASETTAAHSFVGNALRFSYFFSSPLPRSCRRCCSPRFRNL